MVGAHTNTQSEGGRTTSWRRPHTHAEKGLVEAGSEHTQRKTEKSGDGGGTQTQAETIKHNESLGNNHFVLYYDVFRIKFNAFTNDDCHNLFQQVNTTLFA